MHNFDALFDLIPLADIDMPICLAIALPGTRLRTLPSFPQAALPQNGRIASGRGFSADTCSASAFGEAAELASCCAWGDEPIVTATEVEIGPAALTPEALNGWSKAQIKGRTQWNAQYAGVDWRPGKRDRQRPIDWILMENAYGGPTAYAPADFAFIGRRRAGDSDTVAIGDSNGCAAGPTIEKAKLAAILELVERDATGQWWYGRVGRAPVDLASLTIEAGLLAWLKARKRRTWLFDITTDIGIPVFAAASAEQSGRDVALGFAARIEPQNAAIAALSEMLQMEISLNAARAMGAAAGNWAEWCTKVSLATPPLDGASKLAPGPIQALRLPPASSQLAVALEACARHGIDLYFANMTRTEIGVPVVRALSAALCHYKPRFDRKRLFVGTEGSITGTARGNANQVPLLI